MVMSSRIAWTQTYVDGLPANGLAPVLDVNPLPALELLSIRPIRANFGEIEIIELKIKQFSLKKKPYLKIFLVNDRILSHR